MKSTDYVGVPPRLTLNESNIYILIRMKVMVGFSSIILI